MELVLIRLIQGKGFFNGGILFMKASWGDESASIEPIESFPILNIGQEIAFRTFCGDERKVNKKLHLSCIHEAADGTSSKYRVPYVILDPDLESARKWYKLEKLTGDASEEPLLLIETLIEKQISNKELFTAASPEVNVNPKRALSPTYQLPAKKEPLKPILVDDEYFLIGKPDQENQHFYSLSITLAFAENLLNLFPLESAWPSKNVPVDFRFFLMGNPVILKSSETIGNSHTIGERATAKIRTSPEYLLLFLKQYMPNLSIKFCCAEIPVGEAVVPIKEHLERYNLEQNILEKLQLEPVSISGIFPMKSLLQTNIPPSYPQSLQPSVAVVIALTSISPEPVRSESKLSTPQPGQLPLSTGVSPDPAKIDLGFTNDSFTSQPRLSGKLQEDLVYATALELEVWKEEQKILEQEKTSRSRSAYIDLLNSEYRRQVALKEAAFQRRVRHVEELERQLEKSIEDVRQLELKNRQESEILMRQRTQLTRERCLLSNEVDRSTQSLAQKHKFEMNSERRRHMDIVGELRQKLKFQERQLQESNRRIIELEQQLKLLSNQ